MHLIKTAGLKWVVAPLSFSRPVAAFARERLYTTYNVLYYHFIGPRVPYYGLDDGDYRLEQFARDIRKLMGYFDFVPLRDLFTTPQDKTSKPLAALTFDDGFDMINNGVMDFLSKHGLGATTFLITSCLDNQRLMWRNKLMSIRAMVRPEVYLARYNDLARRHNIRTIGKPSELLSASAAWPISSKEQWVDELWTACGMPPEPDFLLKFKPYFTWESLKQWVDSGHSIGLHTATHVHCDRLNGEEIEREIVAPARVLKARFNLDWLPFAYPFGNPLDEQTARTLCSNSVLSSLFGIRGFARRGTPLYRLERAYAQGHFKYQVFGNLFIPQSN
jgi:peptidoglycan/xylan/chitin deacetylase (PgdA/CDA1 family)